MSKFPIRSVFEQIATEVFQMTNVNVAKEFISNFLNEKKIKEEDKKVILYNVSNCKSMNMLQIYICNSLLKFEGMSLN
jgi:hypothetical protein